MDHPDHLFVLANGLIVKNSSKHTGGAKGGPAAASGYNLINSMLQVPKYFSNGAAHAQEDGTVDSVAPAPAGGWHVHIGGKEHYIEPTEELKVKKGDVVEAGDVLSTGIPNPAEIVKHKGVGEGRRYFANAFTQAFRDSGMRAHRRNAELITRGLLNHVEMLEETQDHLPGDVALYHVLERNWEPRDGSDTTSPKSAAGRYLESPVLHYSIGTKIRPSVIRELEEMGVKHVTSHPEPPPFKPVMIRAIGNLEHDPDFMTQFLGANQKKHLLDQARTGGHSELAGTSFVPALAEGTPIGDIWPGNAVNEGKKKPTTSSIWSGF